MKDIERKKTQMAFDTDPFTAEVIKDSLQALCDEMAAAMVKTAISAVIHEIHDFAVCVNDPEGRTLCQGNGVPVFTGLIEPGIRAIIDKFVPVGDVQPGDIFVTNDPYGGGGAHLNDVSLIMPVYYDGKIVAWVANKGHWQDIGGMAFGSVSSDATELFQEGLILPQVKLYSRGQPIQSTLDIILANNRIPVPAMGDIRAGVAALKVGERRVLDLVEKYGVATVHYAMDSLIAYGEKVTREALAKIPDGTYEAQDWVEDGKPKAEQVEIKVKVIVDGDNMVIDLRGNPKQFQNAYNCTHILTRSGVQIAFKAITSPNTVGNHGTYKPLEVLTDPGTIVDCTAPAPVSMYAQVFIALTDLIWKAMAPVLPDRVGAGHYASLSAMIMATTHPETGLYVIGGMPHPGGWGAGPGADGIPAQYCVADGDSRNIPVEVAETRFGIELLQYALHDMPGGEGKWRGGMGVIFDYKIRADEGGLVTVFCGRGQYPSWGLDGGLDGGISYCELIRANGTTERHVIATSVPVAKGDVIRMVTGNGGGYGNPKERSSEAVAEDVKNGYISQEWAQTVYGYEETT